MNTVDVSKAGCRGMMSKCREFKENLPFEPMKSDWRVGDWRQAGWQGRDYHGLISPEMKKP